MFASQLELVRAIAVLGPPCFVFGGMAEDAVLDHAITRPHSDVDVMVPRADLAMRLEQFGAWGYLEWETWLAAADGRPQVLHSSGPPAELEVSILDGEPGRYWFELEAPDGGFFRLLLPPDAFSHPAVVLENVEVHVLSPLALYSIRESLRAAGSFGELRPKDIPVQERLRAMLDGLPADALAPRLEPIE